MKWLMIDWLLTCIEVILLTAIAFGTIWTAYEQHLANHYVYEHPYAVMIDKNGKIE